MSQPQFPDQPYGAAGSQPVPAPPAAPSTPPASYPGAGMPTPVAPQPGAYAPGAPAGFPVAPAAPRESFINVLLDTSKRFTVRYASLTFRVLLVALVLSWLTSSFMVGILGGSSALRMEFDGVAFLVALIFLAPGYAAFAFLGRMFIEHVSTAAARSAATAEG